MSPVLPHITFETAPAPKYSIIWLHGLGADGSDFVPIAEEMNLPVAVNPVLASAIAFVVTMPVGWFAHSSFSFADRSFDRFQPLRFAVSNGAAFSAAAGGMYCITVIGGHS